ncbi:MAG: TetR/AcrR family transcriptional regulator [Acidimicrobiales bacterium]
MPRLWAQTIETHRREVGDAILDTTAALVAEHGLRGVTMSQIAAEAGIGRATLYKYFPDVESILVAWHERHVAGHLVELEELSQKADDPREALDSVLAAYALVIFERARQSSGADVAALVHQGDHVVGIEQRLRAFFGDLLAEAARVGYVRQDVAAPELATYCIHALGAAANAPNKAAVRRLVEVTLAGLYTNNTPKV